MMALKIAILILGLLAMFLLVSSDVVSSNAKEVRDAKYPGGGGYPGYGGGYPGQGGGYPGRGGGYPGRGGGYPGRGGGYPGRGGGYPGRCRYGCCGGRTYNGRCRRCC